MGISECEHGRIWSSCPDCRPELEDDAILTVVAEAAAACPYCGSDCPNPSHCVYGQVYCDATNVFADHLGGRDGSEEQWQKLLIEVVAVARLYDGMPRIRECEK